MYKKYLVLLSLVFALTGCQSQPTADLTDTQPDNVQIEVPFSRGPDSAPFVNGPTSDPPESSVVDQSTGERMNIVPQAVTEIEDITISFPSGAPTSAPPTAAPGE